jgi:hypothetical protein
MSTGRPRLTNIRTYEQAADVHSPGPANSCSRYEHGYRHVVAQVSSIEQRKFGTQPVRKLGILCITTANYLARERPLRAAGNGHGGSLGHALLKTFISSFSAG